MSALEVAVCADSVMAIAWREKADVRLAEFRMLPVKTKRARVRGLGGAISGTMAAWRAPAGIHGGRAKIIGEMQTLIAKKEIKCWRCNLHLGSRCADPDSWGCSGPALRGPRPDFR